MKKVFCILVFFCAYQSVLAQTSKADPTDIQGWYGGTLDINLPRKWAAELDYQARYFNNVRTFNGSYISVGASKEIANFLSLQAEYRLALVSGLSSHRVSVGAEASQQFGEVDISLRALIQNRVQDFDDATISNDHSGYWRVRLGAKFGLVKKLDMYVQTEPIMKFGGVYFIDNWRNTIGFKYKFSKQLKLDAYYIYRPDFAKATYNRLFHINGVSLIYSLKPNGPKNPKIG
jgi:long-subunit fatty acid transport protein